MISGRETSDGIGSMFMSPADKIVRHADIESSVLLAID
jgi:hypothetical protein